MLAGNVLLAHVDDALDPESGADGSGRDAVLARAGLGNDARFSHPPSKKDLTDRVVDLVGPRVAKILALQIDPRSPELGGKPLAECEGCRSADIFAKQLTVFGLKGGIEPRFPVGGSQFRERRNEHLRHERSSIRAEMAAGIGQSYCVFIVHIHATPRYRFSLEPLRAMP